MLNQQDPPPGNDCATAATSFNTALPQLLDDRLDNDQQKIDILFLAILTLCPFAFCAYADANENHGWTEFTEDGCIVQHLSWDCLKEHVQGVLRIKLERARHLPIALISRPGRFIVFSTGSSRESSTGKWNDCHPCWNTTHCLLIKKNCDVEHSSSRLTIELHNSETCSYASKERARLHKLRGKKCLGSASIALSEILRNEGALHTPRLELKRSRRLDRAPVVKFRTQRISLEHAWKDARKNTEPADAWEQHMPKSKKDCNWDFLNEKNSGDFKPIGFINAVKRGTQVWVYADQNTKAIAIAFRGTEKTKLEDVRTVIQIQPSTLHWENTGNCKLNSTLDRDNNEMSFHAGFVKAYGAVRIALLEIVYSVTGWSEEWTICFTGHSLGGALAVLCSFDYVHLKDQAGKKPKVFMMTFGAPRVGNKAFKETYKEAVKHGYRVACGKDVVCGLPCHLSHVGRELRFDRYGRVFLNKTPVADVKAEAEIIKKNTIVETVVRKWNHRVRRQRSFGGQSTVRDRGIGDTSSAQEETPARSLIRSNAFRRRVVVPIRTGVMCRSAFQRSLKHFASFKVDRLELLPKELTSFPWPSVADHAEERYNQFAMSLATCFMHLTKYVHWRKHRHSSVTFRSLICSIQAILAHRNGTNSANQHHED